MTPYRSSIITILALTFSSVSAADMLWNDFSLSYLKGNDYEVGDPKREVITLEHASGHTWGDTFLFIDRLESDSGDVEEYLEFSPRLSLGHLTSSDLSFGPVKDVFLAATWEKGEDFDNQLVGIGFSLDIPGFSYVNANIYKVRNDNQENDEQLALSWAYPFSIGTGEFIYDGFLDWSTAHTGGASEMNFTSQLKWNMGKLFDTQSPIYIGMEYVYWNNKYGIKGVDERNPNLIIKWHL